MRSHYPSLILSLYCFIYFPLLGSEPIFGIMITGKDSYHIPLAKLSIESFLTQTYENKTLIIINDGEAPLGPFTTDRIIEIFLTKQYSLGELRNIALDYLPENSLWIQWDDDDWHHPNVIQEQYTHLISEQADLCYMKNQVRYAFSQNSAWTFSSVIYGSIMARKKGAIYYPAIGKEEDKFFFSSYKELYPITEWNNPEYYYLRFIHGHNTWDDAHFALHKKPQNSWTILEESKEYLSAILPKYPLISQPGLNCDQAFQ